MKDSDIKGTGNSRYLKSSLEGITTWEQFRNALAAGTLPVDLNGINPDGFQQLGDPLNKASLLKDYTCGLLGLPNTAVPDDALLALLIGVGYYGYRVKVQLADGSPVEGATVSGISALPGSSLVTGADGIAVGRSSSASVTINCTSPYIDQKAPAAQVVTKTGTITDVTLTLTNIVDAIKITKSGKFSSSQNAISVDIYGIGGGGGGSASSFDGTGGNGGGGGHAINVLQYPLSAKRNISVVIGSGGLGGSTTGDGGNPGGDGGTTQVQIDSATILTAAGGTGATSAAVGTGGSDGGSGLVDGANPGSDDSTYLFNDISLGIVAGGAGGGGCGYHTSSTYRVRGGSPNGGAGGVCGLSVSYEGSDVNGEDGKMGGGGGGGGTRGTSIAEGGAGGAGGVYLRFHFDAA